MQFSLYSTVMGNQASNCFTAGAESCALPSSCSDVYEMNGCKKPRHLELGEDPDTDSTELSCEFPETAPTVTVSTKDISSQLISQQEPGAIPAVLPVPPAAVPALADTLGVFTSMSLASENFSGSLSGSPSNRETRIDNVTSRCSTAGREDHEEEDHPNNLDYDPTDVVITVVQQGLGFEQRQDNDDTN
jgi:hypothetical protein